MITHARVTETPESLNWRDERTRRAVAGLGYLRAREKEGGGGEGGSATTTTTALLVAAATKAHGTAIDASTAENTLVLWRYLEGHPTTVELC